MVFNGYSNTAVASVAVLDNFGNLLINGDLNSTIGTITTLNSTTGTITTLNSTTGTINKLKIAGTGMYCDNNNPYVHLYGSTPNTYSDIASTFGIGKGLVIGWNKTIGFGYTDLVNMGEGGSGGFQFWSCNGYSNTTVTSVAVLDNFGNLAVNGITSTTGTINNGTITTLNSTTGTISTLNSTTGTITTLNSANATVSLSEWP